MGGIYRKDARQVCVGEEYIGKMLDRCVWGRGYIGKMLDRCVWGRNI